MPTISAVTKVERVEERILQFRGEKVLLDIDLARLYEVPVKRLNQAVKRNRGRFPPDFMFQLDREEWATLRSQFVTSKAGRGGRQYPPYALLSYELRAASGRFQMADRRLRIAI